MDEEMFQASMPTLSAEEIENDLHGSNLFDLAGPTPTPDSYARGRIELMEEHINLQAEQIRQLQRAWSSLVATAFVNNPEGYAAYIKRTKENWRY